MLCCFLRLLRRQADQRQCGSGGSVHPQRGPDHSRVRADLRGNPHFGLHDRDPRRAVTLLRCCLSRPPRLKGNGSPQLNGIGFPLSGSLQLAEQIPGLAHANLLRHGSNWVRRAAVGHDGLQRGVLHNAAAMSMSDPPGWERSLQLSISPARWVGRHSPGCRGDARAPRATPQCRAQRPTVPPLQWTRWWPEPGQKRNHAPATP